MHVQMTSTRSLTMAVALRWRPAPSLPPAGVLPARDREDGEGPERAGRARRPEHDPGRSFLGRALHRLEKAVAGRIREALRESDLDPASRKAIGKLLKQFHHDLRDAVHAAAHHGKLDTAALEEGIGEALHSLTQGLHAVLDAAGLPAAGGTANRTGNVAGGAGTVLPGGPSGPQTAPVAGSRGPVVSVEFAVQLVLTGRIQVFA